MNSTYRDAIRHPLNIAMLVLTVSAGLVSAWWLLPIGLLLWFIMVRGVAAHPVTQAQSTQPERPEVAARFQSAVERLEAGQLRMLNAIGETRPPLRQALEPLQAEINRLVDKGHDVARRAAPLENQRKARAKLDGDLPQELATLDRQLAEFTDEAVKRNLAKSRATMQSRLDHLRTLTGQLDRIDAGLAGAVSVIEQAAAGLDQLRASKPGALADSISALTARLRQQSTVLDAL
jgi:chromosome segregation ATPase